MNLKDKVALVTGGATGIGKQISLQLANAGATIIVNYNLSDVDAKSLVKEINNNGGRAECIQSNVSSFQDCEKLINNIVEKYGKIDILVNNAGITADTLILRMTEEEFDRVIKVNLKGTWSCCKHAIKHMVKQRSGKIINISSISGIVGNAGQTNYSASKAGIIGLTKSLAREVAKRGICVNAVAPGFIKTKMTDVLSKDIVEEYVKSIPVNRMGEPEDVANLVVFLASDLANYITGQVVNVDGGLVMN